MDDDSQFLTVTEAAELLRLKPQTLYRRVCERSIAFTKTGGRLLFSRLLLMESLQRATFIPSNGKSAR